jgi:hypothetical protein
MIIRDRKPGFQCHASNRLLLCRRNCTGPIKSKGDGKKKKKKRSVDAGDILRRP